MVARGWSTGLCAAAGRSASGAPLAEGNGCANRKSIIAKINRYRLDLFKKTMLDYIGKSADLKGPVAIALLIHADNQPRASAGVGLQKDPQGLHVFISKKGFQLLPGTLGDFKHAE